jgi:hypothetical protein
MKLPPSISFAPVILLTGAGASAPLGLHPTKPFLRYFLDGPFRQLERRADSEKAGDMQKVLLQIRLLASPENVDIERILSFVERDAQDVDRLKSDRAFMDTVTFGQPAALERFIECNQMVRDLIYQEVIKHYDTIDTRAAASLYRPLFMEFRKWLAQVPKVGSTIPLFTLNYDRAVEAAASQLGIHVVDGLQDEVGATERRWNRAAFEAYKARNNRPTVVLVKLHGSVRWGRNADDQVVQLPSGLSHNPGDLRQVVLYPSDQLKPMHVDPFSTMYRIFRQCLNNAYLLVVIGCSLRDQEIQTAVSDAMDDNEKMHMLSFGPEASHELLASDLRLDPRRVAAVQRHFEVAEPNQSENEFMACIRGFAQTAVGVGRELGADRVFRFGETYAGWPWPSKEQLSRIVPSGRLHHRFGGRS